MDGIHCGFDDPSGLALVLGSEVSCVSWGTRHMVMRANLSIKSLELG